MTVTDQLLTLPANSSITQNFSLHTPHIEIATQLTGTSYKNGVLDPNCGSSELATAVGPKTVFWVLALSTYPESHYAS